MAYKFDPNDQTTHGFEDKVFISVETIRKNIGDLGMKTIQVMKSEAKRS